MAGGAPRPPRPPRGRSGTRPPELDAIDSPAGTSLMMEGMSLPTTYTVPVVGSAALPKFNAPPFTLGMRIVSTNPGGVKNPVRALDNRSFHHAFSSSVMNASYISLTVIPCRLNGGTTVGKGCVGDVTSPGTSDCGTGRSSMGQSGLPVTRSNTNRNPVLDASAT